MSFKWDKCLYLIVDFSYGKERIEEALRHGVDIVQLREKNCSSGEYVERALWMREITRKYNTILIINDRLDVALACEADGVHLGQSDMPVELARKILGPEKIIGSTAKTVEQALEAKLKGADYLGSGAWYSTSTKPDALPMKPETYREIVEKSGLPNVAIGGLNAKNCRKPMEYGATGLAVSAGIMQGNIKENIQAFRDAMK